MFTPTEGEALGAKMRNRQTQNYARALRESMPDAERHLWQRLRKRQVFGYKFRRQFPIVRYIADFACIEAGLVIEIDGGQHNENTQKDAARTRSLNASGFRVLRFWNHHVLSESEAVMEVIANELRAWGEVAGSAPTSASAPAPTPALPRERGRG